ncbi:MAG: phosphate ABC transporter substrate-binding protein PstS [Actinomycetota bacterium]|nr:phosphate ABC transporter substrate-binding protein PstS [Actinomycetota bacterium]
MRLRSLIVAVAVGALALSVAACGSSKKSSSGGGAETLNGAGSTFAAPFYQQWGTELMGKDNISINYNPVGSGAGIAQFTAGTVDFGATDPPMKPEEVKAAQAKGDPLNVPMGLGAITVSYNLSGVKTGLKLDGPTIASVFLGKVKNWNNRAIAKLNPGTKLPSTSITVVHRSDSSGTTKGFTGFLAAVSPEWKSKVGSDKDVKWPTGTGAKGNQGVAGAVKSTAGSIGYVEQAYALQNNFTFASVKNKSGKFVVPTLQSTTAGAEGVAVPPDLRFTIKNPSNPAAYPITSQTFALVYRDPCKAGLTAGKAQALKKFLDYGLGAGQDVLKQLQYAPLPASIDTKAKALVATMQCNGKALA